MSARRLVRQPASALAVLLNGQAANNMKTEDSLRVG